MERGGLLIIYDVYTLDNDYYNPLNPIGIYIDFEVAKKVAESNSAYMETLHVDVLELQGDKFEVKERRIFDKLDDNPKWKKED